jgi:hypothetical protein
MSLHSRPPDRPVKKPLVPRRHFAAPLGLGVLVPGLAQRNWGQDGRGLVLLVSFASSLVAAILCWGSPLGWLFLGFAIWTHALATLDVFRQRSFPVFPRFVAVLATALGLGTTTYFPALAALVLFAFPVQAVGTAGHGYLVNRTAYGAADPASGHIVWLSLRPETPPRAGRVLALAGQKVEWNTRRWWVDGHDVSAPDFRTPLQYPDTLSFTVPEHHLLIGLEQDGARTEPCGPLVLVSRDQVVGRIWARYSPFWERCLL